MLGIFIIMISYLLVVIIKERNVLKIMRELGKKGVEIIYFPYTDGTSSSQLRALISEKNVD